MYLRQVAILPTNKLMTQRQEIKARMTQPEMTQNYRERGRYQLDLFCVPGRPRRITLSATCQDASRLPAKPRAVPHTEVSHTLCRSAASWEISRRPGVGCMSHLVMQACVRTWAETHTITHSQGCSASVITEYKKKKQKRSSERGSSAFVIVMKRNKNDTLSCTLCFHRKQ